MTRGSSGFWRIEVVIMGQDIRKIPVAKGTTVEEFCTKEGIDTGNEINLNGRNLTNIDTKFTRDSTLVATPSVKGA